MSQITVYPVAGANSPVDGYIGKSAGTYAGARDASSGDSVSVTATAMYIANAFFGGNYNVRRAIMCFDTSAIGAGQTITSATFSIRGNGDKGSANGWSVDLVGATPAGTADLLLADFSQVGGTLFSDTEISLSSFSSSAYNDFPLNAAGLAAINSGGITVLAVRVSGDRLNEAANADSDYTGILSADNGSNKPQLVVNYSPATTPPTVTTQAVSSIGTTSATGNGNITATGTSTPDERGFVWSTSSHGDPGNVAPASSGYSGAQTSSGSFGTGAFTGSLSSLSAGTLYYVRAYAHSSDGYAYGSEVSFTTTSTTPPTLTTSAATDTDVDRGTLNGNITALGTSTPTTRGFVWGTSSQSAPGDVAPASSGYDDYNTETGSFSTGAFTYALTGLDDLVPIYFRSWAHSADGYAYGSQQSFTPKTPSTFRYTNLSGLTFDPADTETVFAERLNDILARLEALE